MAALRSNSGITRGACLQYEALRRIGADVELLDATDALRNPLFRIKHRPATAYIFHSGGPQIASLLMSVLPQAKRAHRIAYWAWELPCPPKNWPDPNGLVAEIWTPSSYSKRSLSLGFDVPIHVVPHVVPVTHRPIAGKRAEPFTVLVLADSRSSIQRKNVQAAIGAFFEAFGKSCIAQLVIKLNGHASDFAELLISLRASPNVSVIDRLLDDSAMLSLFASASVVMSLHRAEGFGLPMLEAMSVGVPVIATGWSGNLDFMDESNSVLVPSKQIAVQDRTVYSRYADATWADPDLRAAAQALRRLYSDTPFYEEISLASRKTAVDLLHTWPEHYAKVIASPHLVFGASQARLATTAGK